VIALSTARQLNVMHNPHIESVHFGMRMKGAGKYAADMFSTLMLSNVTTVGFDTNGELLRDFEETRNLKCLDSILVSGIFPRLCRILIRLQYDIPPTSSTSIDNPLNILYHVFSRCQARGILQVKSFPYQGIIWHLTDDCYSSMMFNHATATS
jgi:hypothetical protein